MPGFNGMGPSGKGSMTGRGLGQCAAALNKPQSGLQRGFFRRGLGRQGQRGFDVSDIREDVDSDTRLQKLEAECQFLKEKLVEIQENAKEK